MLDKIITFIDQRRNDNKGKFSEDDYFREFLFRDLRKEFSTNVKIDTNIENKEKDDEFIKADKVFIKKIISKNKEGRIKNQKNAESYLRKVEKENMSDENCCTVAEAMRILGTDKRREIDIPVSKGLIKKVGKKGVSTMLNRSSVQEYAISIKNKQRYKKMKPKIDRISEKIEKIQEEEKENIVISGPGVNIQLPTNDPNKIMNEEDDDEDEY